MQHPRAGEVSTPHWDALESISPVFQPDRAVAAVLVPLYMDVNESVRVIMTKRPDNMRTHPGDVVFPGGRIEPGESAVDAAIREACEEVGLPEDAVDVVGGLSPITTRDPNNLIVPVVARVTRPDVLVPQPEEVEIILEPTIDALLDETRWNVSEWFGRNLWFFDFPEATLWGATAFMVRELLEVFRSNQDSSEQA
jgi:8-oxo-dGTP pyrophosphatase MutT (NUDIX family)